MGHARWLPGAAQLLLGVCTICTIWTGCAQTAPIRLYSGERLSKSVESQVRVRGIHRVEAIDSEEVKGNWFAVEPGRHRLEFYSRSKGSVFGLGIPYFDTRCAVELEMEAGHLYELDGEIESRVADPSHYDGLAWRLHSLDARLVDETSGEAVDGLSCSHPCKAVGRSGSTYKWMPCERYREVTSNPPAEAPAE